MSDQNANVFPHPSSPDPSDAIDVVQNLIDLCRQELNATAQLLEVAASQGDAERAAATILEIQAVSLLHGLDDIAVLATEAEHAMELNPESSATWNDVATRLVRECRASLSHSDEAS